MKQLVMKRELKNIPCIELPSEYDIRSYIEGDEVYWDKIISSTFESNDFVFNEFIKSREQYSPEKVLFVTYKNIPIGTATAWFQKQYGEDTGYLHMVGVEKEHSGKRLGYTISLAVLNKMIEIGYKYCVLQTDDYRIPAIKTYLKLGYKPLIVSEDQYDRWKIILDKINKNDIIEEVMSQEIYKYK